MMNSFLNEIVFPRKCTSLLQRKGQVILSQEIPVFCAGFQNFLSVFQFFHNIHNKNGIFFWRFSKLIKSQKVKKKLKIDDKAPKNNFGF